MKDSMGLSGSSGFASPSEIGAIFPGQGLERGKFRILSGVPQGRSVCVASSRLGRKPDRHDRWFDALRTLAVRIDPDRHFLVTASGTTTDPFVRRVANLFGISLVELVELGPVHGRAHVRGNGQEPIASEKQAGGSGASREPIDAALIAIANEVYLLSVRQRGNIHAAALARLARMDDLAPQRSRVAPDLRLVDSLHFETRLLIDTSLTPTKVSDELVSAGAIGWWLFDGPPVRRPAPQCKIVDPAGLGRDAPILRLGEICPDRYLIHSTRRRVGPWPDQSSDEYMDDLIFQDGRRSHDEVSALARILATRRILASRDLMRDGQPMVCFTKGSLAELLGRKIFRPHLGRWDNLPFGIAVDREVLADRGGRRVIYGDDTVWASLPSGDRSFFQVASSKNGRIDWTDEKEWRWRGDLDLKRLPHDSVVVFVETMADAARVAPLSYWPVVVLRAS